MTHTTEFAELMRSITEKSAHLLEGFKNDPDQIILLLQQFIEITEYLQTLWSMILSHPEKAWTLQLTYWTQAMSLAEQQFTHWLQGEPLPMNDKRFSNEAWLNNSFFNFMSHQYILACEHIDSLLHELEPEDEQSAKRVRFFSKQYLDALSPANFLHTNPQILNETIQSHGNNLLKGLHNLLSDLEQGASSLEISMTDTDAFKLGENLATTPGAVIFRNEMMELIQYTPTTKKVAAIPLLIIPPWINKYYILDLSPHNSLVRWLVAQGISVFIISWVNPDERFAHKGLVDYMEEGPRTAIELIKKQMSCSLVNTVGFCIGGTLLATTLAYNQAHQDKSINSATFLASMIDFSDPGDIAALIDEHQFKKIEQEMQSKGYLPGKVMANSFNSLRANDLVWSFFIKNYLQGKAPVPFDMLFWNSDSTNMPATMHSQYLRWMYLQNDLIKPGAICLNNTPIDITQIKIPTFFLSTEKDHIAPWKTTYLGFQMMKGPKRFVLGGSGHIAGIINAPKAKKYGYRSTSVYKQLSADQWYARAKEYSGSWWPEWGKWLIKHSGAPIDTPLLSTLPYPALTNAPGTYVFQAS